jgi:YHS domain-containing protein
LRHPEQRHSDPDKAKSVAYNNKTYHFCCPGCKAKFESDPARFAKEADEKAAKRAAGTTTKS